jgi:hypothetical protein
MQRATVSQTKGQTIDSKHDFRLLFVMMIALEQESTAKEEPLRPCLHSYYSLFDESRTRKLRLVFRYSLEFLIKLELKNLAILVDLFACFQSVSE